MTSFLSFMEILAVQYRSVAGVAFTSFWPIGVMSLALMSFLIQDWRYIQLLTTLLPFIQTGTLL